MVWPWPDHGFSEVLLIGGEWRHGSTAGDMRVSVVVWLLRLEGQQVEVDSVLADLSALLFVGHCQLLWVAEVGGIDVEPRACLARRRRPGSPDRTRVVALRAEWDRSSSGR
jgi:hypothetical protein